VLVSTHCNGGEKLAKGQTPATAADCSLADAIFYQLQCAVAMLKDSRKRVPSGISEPTYYRLVICIKLIEQDSMASPSGAFHRSHRLAKANSQTSEIMK